MLLDAYNLQERKKPHILEDAIFLASHTWQVGRFVVGAKMLVGNMNLSFPQSFSSFLPSAGLSGSSWLLRPKLQLEFCCETSSVISSFQLRKAKHNRSGVWHTALGVLAQRSQNFSCSLSTSEPISSVKSLTRAGKGFFAVFPPGFLPLAGRIHIFPSSWLQEAAPDFLWGKEVNFQEFSGEELNFQRSRDPGSLDPVLGWV